MRYFVWALATAVCATVLGTSLLAIPVGVWQLRRLHEERRVCGMEVELLERAEKTSGGTLQQRVEALERKAWLNEELRKKDSNIQQMVAARKLSYQFAASSFGGLILLLLLRKRSLPAPAAADAKPSFLRRPVAFPWEIIVAFVPLTAMFVWLLLGLDGVGAVFLLAGASSIVTHITAETRTHFPRAWFRRAFAASVAGIFIALALFYLEDRGVIPRIPHWLHWLL